MNNFSFLSNGNFLSETRFINFIIALVGISYFLFNFLAVEDSNVYFSRLNYLEGGDIFIYYNGQIHLLAQFVAYILSIFPPLFQAIGYTLFSLVTFILFISLLYKIVENKLLVLILICYLGAFFPLLFYNLTNSIWPSLFITALVPAVAYKEKRSLGWTDFFIVLIFSTSQAPSLVTLPLYFILLKRTGFDLKLSFLIIWIFILSSLILPNWNSARADLYSNLQANIYSFLIDPVDFLTPSLSLKSDLPSRIVEVISFFGMFIIALINLIKRKLEGIDIGLFLFAFGIFLLSFSSKIYDNFFIGPRYFVPSMIVFLIFIDPYLKNLEKPLKFIASLSILLVIVIFSDRYLMEKNNRIEDLVSLAQFQESKVIIDRGGGWAVALGPFSKFKSDCTIPVERSVEDRFLIYCGDGEGEILLKQ